MNMKTVGLIFTIIIVLAAASRVQAERTGPGTYRGYYNETRWGDRVLHLGPYHTFVSEAVAKALLKHKGKPLEVDVTDLSQPPLGRGMIQAVGKVKENGSLKGLRIKAELESKKVERGDGVTINIALRNSTAKDITIDSAKLAVVLAANSPRSQNKIDYKDPDGRSYWYYRYSYLTSGDEAGPSGIACHQTLLRWSDKQFSGIEVDPARNRVTKGDQITVEANGTFTASYTAAKELPDGEYELFVYLVSGNLSSVPGPMSSRLAFDVVEPPFVPDFSRGIPGAALEKTKESNGIETFHLKTALSSKEFSSRLGTVLGAGWSKRKLAKADMLLAIHKGRALNAEANLSVYEHPKLPGVNVRVIHFKHKKENAGSTVEIGVILPKQ